MNARFRSLGRLLVLAMAVVAVVAGCSDDAMLNAPAGDDGDKAAHAVFQVGDTPPGVQAAVSVATGALTFWPYTGRSFDGEPIDPINLVFAGQASPLQIRAALLALDGDRTAYDFPPIPPFDQTWQDAIGGDVQTTWAADGHGWVGSIIQLTLGDFGPLRVHLRLFQTGADCGHGCWTLGGAHFEMQIPNVAEHQVLDWELAEAIVVVDLLRSGLLNPASPAVPTGPINEAPSFRTIPAMIYNLLPPELVELIGGPPQPVTEDVPIDSDGQGTLLDLVTPAPVVSDEWTQSLTVQYEQVVPRPYCSDGPGDYLYITGPVSFSLTTAVSAAGEYTGEVDYAGVLEALPVDVSGGTPVPIGNPFKAQVHGRQQGQLGASGGWIMAIDAKLTHEDVGPQLIDERLVVHQIGTKTFRAYERCLDPGEMTTGY